MMFMLMLIGYRDIYDMDIMKVVCQKNNTKNI